MRFHRTPVKLRRPLRPGANGASADPAVVTDTIEEIVRLENKDREHMGFSDELANKITAFSGSMLFVWLHVAWFTFWAPWYPALAAIDIRRIFQDHYQSIDLEVENFDQRLSCYELQIGLEHIAYAAFSGRQVGCRRCHQVQHGREFLEHANLAVFHRWQNAEAAHQWPG